MIADIIAILSGQQTALDWQIMNLGTCRLRSGIQYFLKRIIYFDKNNVPGKKLYNALYQNIVLVRLNETKQTAGMSAERTIIY